MTKAYSWESGNVTKVYSWASDNLTEAYRWEPQNATRTGNWESGNLTRAGSWEAGAEGWTGNLRPAEVLPHLQFQSQDTKLKTENFRSTPQVK